jgi:hypothetical protein
VTAGLNVHDAVKYATTANIASATYTPGSTGADLGSGVGATLVFPAVAIDGVTLTSQDATDGTRILVKNQTPSTYNGIYKVTTVSTNITLTRSSDADNSILGELSAGDFIYVAAGGQAGTGWTQTVLGTAVGGGIKIGTDNVNYTQFSGAGTYTGSNGVTVSGTTISGVNATSSTVGVAAFPTSQFTVTTGSVAITALSGSLISSGLVSPTYGGTGVNNGTNTLTLAGNVSHAGAYTQTFTATANTSVTLPTGGNLTNTAVTLTSGSILKGNGTSEIAVATGADIATAIGSNTVTNATNATNATNVAVTNDAATATTVYPAWVGANTGNTGVKTTSAALSFVPSTGVLSATIFSGSGANLTSLNAANVASGTLPGARGVTSGSATASFVTYNGTTVTAGQFDGGTTAPSGTTRLNYGGYFYATQFYGDGSNLSNLNGSNIASGTVAFARLATTYIGNTATQSAVATQALGGLTSVTGYASGSTNSTNFIVSSGAFTNAGAPISTGNLTLATGKADGISSSGNSTLSGSVYVDVGSATNAATNTPGTIYIGTQNGGGFGAPATIKIGQSGVTTNVAGTLVVGTLNGLIKGTSGTLSAATAGTDYVVSLTGTTNRVTVSGSSGVLTVTAPQDIHTAATPQFAGLGLGTTAPAAGLTISGGKITAAAGVAGYASLLITAGSADPTSPVSGDIWNNAGVLKFRDASSVSQVVALAGSAGDTLNSTITKSSLTKVGVLSSGTAGYVKVDSSGNLTSVNETYTRKYSENNGALTAVTGSVTWTVTHNLSTSNVTVQVYQNSTNALVDVDVVTTSANVVTLTLNSASLTGSEYRTVVVG